jgi:flagellar biosynthesis anti-sigma factor FlgM
MEINGLGHIDGPQPIRAPHRAEAIQPQNKAESVQGTDQVDISPEADAVNMVNQIHDLPEIRTDRVAEIRAQIETGAYETDEKLDVALGRFLDEIG